MNEPAAAVELSAAGCPKPGCSKTSVQCLNVSKPIVFTPTATLGNITTTCVGAPTVTCVASPDGRSCTVTLTQRVCAVIPITFGAAAAGGDPSIACAAIAGEAECPCRGSNA